jgi:hypothetical protein
MDVLAKTGRDFTHSNPLPDTNPEDGKPSIY